MYLKSTAQTWVAFVKWINNPTNNTTPYEGADNGWSVPSLFLQSTLLILVNIFIIAGNASIQSVFCVFMTILS